MLIEKRKGKIFVLCAKNIAMAIYDNDYENRLTLNGFD